MKDSEYRERYGSIADVDWSALPQEDLCEMSLSKNKKKLPTAWAKRAQSELWLRGGHGFNCIRNKSNYGNGSNNKRYVGFAKVNPDARVDVINGKDGSSNPHW